MNLKLIIIRVLSKYTTQTNEMQNFLTLYLIPVVSYMFRTSWVHPQGDSCIYNMVRFTNTDAYKP
jgi:hypothetical protein